MASRPAVEGVLRSTDGAALSGVTVQILNRQLSQISAWLTSGDGRFTVPAESSGCEGVWVRAWPPGYLPRTAALPPCTIGASREPISMEIRVQPGLIASTAVPVETTLSNNDLDWAPDTVAPPDCGPCKRIGLPSPDASGLDVTIEWSGPDRLTAWFDAANRNYDPVSLAVIQAEPGARMITATLPPNTEGHFYHAVRVGLPAASRATGGLSGVHDLRVTVRRP